MQRTDPTHLRRRPESWAHLLLPFGGPIWFSLVICHTARQYIALPITMLRCLQHTALGIEVGNARI
ncbi:hypothetical protein BD311DRAFT_752922 [Dichomitus squalens]|uniref:Uncharacterized protein n=1 Tax=Dichomitus squalens TaxID=114155 RepID=A0A4Q9MU95_9APHY|nr:hypothetical protein BD311DRAFT_752922 [Dichomitus squalens]